MKIDGYTRVCGVMGNPVEHTMSPAIHNTLAQALGENLVYIPFHVPAGHAGDAVRGAYALNLLGMNVTVPYKRDVVPFLKEIDPLAETIGAVNTLVRTEGPIQAHNISRRTKLNNGSSREIQMVITFHTEVIFNRIIYRDARN